MAVLGRADPGRSGIHRHGVEFLAQRELLDQRFAQIGVVLDDENGRLAGHGFDLFEFHRRSSIAS